MLAKDIVRPGGCAFLWKGSRYIVEMREGPGDTGAKFWDFETARRSLKASMSAALYS